MRSGAISASGDSASRHGDQKSLLVPVVAAAVEVMVMQDTSWRRPTYILKRGAYDAKGPVAAPARSAAARGWLHDRACVAYPLSYSVDWPAMLTDFFGAFTR